MAKMKIKNAVNFDMVAPGSMLVLNFDGDTEYRLIVLRSGSKLAQYMTVDPENGREGDVFESLELLINSYASEIIRVIPSHKIIISEED